MYFWTANTSWLPTNPYKHNSITYTHTNTHTRSSSPTPSTHTHKGGRLMEVICCLWHFLSPPGFNKVTSAPFLISTFFSSFFLPAAAYTRVSCFISPPISCLTLFARNFFKKIILLIFTHGPYVPGSCHCDDWLLTELHHLQHCGAL